MAIEQKEDLSHERKLASSFIRALAFCPDAVRKQPCLEPLASALGGRAR
jgi:hypothetical protein